MIRGIQGASPMYFGLYQISNKHLRFDASPHEAPCAGPSLLGLLGLLKALFRRLFHQI
jgi:hypothetical protein